MSVWTLEREDLEDIPNSGDTNTSDSRNESVCRRDVSGMASAPHDPGGGRRESTSKSQHLNTSITLERRVGNDAVLDSIGSSGSDKDGSKHFEDGTEDHSLSVRDGSRRDTGGPGVGNIVYQN
jgi:hypothetical protein